mmetsp:Transcript_38516/g.95661  ORF Transcript_38516/g.95661 Transcript_38516/m.95661 type:complete len:209 (+) Transcript_38516:579-1205(+)
MGPTRWTGRDCCARGLPLRCSRATPTRPCSQPPRRLRRPATAVTTRVLIVGAMATPTLMPTPTRVSPTTQTAPPPPPWRRREPSEPQSSAQLRPKSEDETPTLRARTPRKLPRTSPPDATCPTSWRAATAARVPRWSLGPKCSRPSRKPNKFPNCWRRRGCRLRRRPTLPPPFRPCPPLLPRRRARPRPHRIPPLPLSMWAESTPVGP